MKTILAAILCTLFLTFPAQAGENSQEAGHTEEGLSQGDVHLVRYAYVVEWSGAESATPQGRVGIAVLADLKNDQHQLQLVREDGHLLGRMVQQGTLTFSGATGENMEPAYDLVLGMGVLGVPVGLSTFVDWAQGKDGRGPLEEAHIDRDDEGMARELKEAGWTISYEGWGQAKGDPFDVPTKWKLTHAYGLSMHLTLVEAKAYSGLRIPDDYNPISIR